MSRSAPRIATPDSGAGVYRRRATAPAPAIDAIAEPGIRALYEAIELGNFDALGEFFHDKAVYRRPGCSPMVGRSRIIDYYRRVRSIATSRIIVDSVIAQGVQAVASGLVEGRGREGEPVHEQFADLYAFENGLVIQRTTYFFRHGF